MPTDHETKRIDAALKALLLNLPESQRGWWLDLELLHTALVRGGISQLPREVLEHSLLTFRKTLEPRKDHFGQVATKYFCFGTLVQQQYTCAKDQFEAIKNDSNIQVPRVHPGYFLNETRPLKVKSAIQILRQAGYIDSDSLTTPTTSRVLDNGDTNVVSADSRNGSTNESDQRSDQDAAEEELPPDDALRSGYKVVDIDEEQQFLKEIQKHSIQCGHLMQLLDRDKMGFDLKEDYQCNYCHTKIRRRSACNAARKGKRGPAPSELNVTLAESCYECGIPPTKGLTMFERAGIFCPSRTAWDKMTKKVQSAAHKLSLEQLANNRQKHVAMARAMDGYEGDIQFNGRSVSRGTIIADGGGPTRAYDHRITGSQHGLIIFSGITGDPIYTECDQISCVHCSRKLTQYLKLTNKKAQDIQPGDIDFSHPGRCYRNSKYSPAQAEEYAMEKAGEFLLNLPDNKAIFAEIVVTDGDTRGQTRLISRQAEIIGPAAEGQAIYIPDSGHFIKCISNGLYELKRRDPTLGGSGLLEPTRIRAISGDIMRHLRSCHDELMLLDLDDEAGQAAATEGCLWHAESIVPHHCGDHTLCSVSDCLYLQLEQKVRQELDAASPETIREVVAERYAKQSRFKGKLLSLNKAGQKKVSEVITKRLNEGNIERIAELMTSNKCKNFFGKLIKWTEGKCLYLGQTDAYSILLEFVAGMQSDHHHGTHLLKELGAAKTEPQMHAMERQERRFEKQKLRKQSEEYTERRAVNKVQKLHNLAKAGKSSSVHKTDKVDPNDDG